MRISDWSSDVCSSDLVFLTSHGADRQVDADILAKCLLAARAKGRVGQEIAQLTVDAPVPYLLSDLTNIIQLEMGKMDRPGDTATDLRLMHQIAEITDDPSLGLMFSGLLAPEPEGAFMAHIFGLQVHGP